MKVKLKRKAKMEGMCFLLASGPSQSNRSRAAPPTCVLEECNLLAVALVLEAHQAAHDVRVLREGGA